MSIYVTELTRRVLAKHYWVLYKMAVPRYYKSTTACLCPLASTLFYATFLTINWIETQEHTNEAKNKKYKKIKRLTEKKLKDFPG